MQVINVALHSIVLKFVLQFIDDVYLFLYDIFKCTYSDLLRITDAQLWFTPYFTVWFAFFKAVMLSIVILCVFKGRVHRRCIDIQSVVIGLTGCFVEAMIYRILG